MTPAYANEKLVIDLKHVLEDIDAIAAMDGEVPFGASELEYLRADIIRYTCGIVAQYELKWDRERAAQGARQQKGEHA